MRVLILVLMEDTLRVLQIRLRSVALRSLNPCSNGRYSQRFNDTPYANVDCVLILVLMEDTLREHIKHRVMGKDYGVLILVLMEDTLRARLRLLRFVTLSVLILVLMEDTLRVQRKHSQQHLYLLS